MSSSSRAGGRDPWTSTDYATFGAAVGDADTVLFELRRQIQAELLVPADEVDFALRRAQQLLRAALDALPAQDRLR